MEKLAENPSSGGIANAGIGLGMGFGVAGQFSNAFTGIGQNVNAAPAPVSAQSTQIVCPKCGAQNSQSMKFCGNCGNKLAATVICPHCGKEVPAGMKFCGECGQPLGSSKCPSCGFENEPGMKFCGNCGGKL